MCNKKIISFEITNDYLDKIKEFSAERDCSVSASIRYIIKQYFENIHNTK